MSCHCEDAEMSKTIIHLFFHPEELKNEQDHQEASETQGQVSIPMFFVPMLSLQKILSVYTHSICATFLPNYSQLSGLIIYKYCYNKVNAILIERWRQLTVIG